MNEDSVVKEVREAREAFAKECAYDAHTIIDRLRADESRHTERLVTPEMFEKRNAARRTA